MSTSLSGGGGCVTATIHITRKATGQVETYQLVMPVSSEQAQQLELEQPKADDERNPLDRGT